MSIINHGDIMGAIVYPGRPEEIVDYQLRDVKTGTVYTPDKYVKLVFKPHGASVWMAKWELPIGLIILPAKMSHIKASAKERIEDIGLKIEPYTPAKTRKK